MRSASTLHLHREPCSEHQAAVFGLTYPSPSQLSPREPPIVDQNCVAHHPVWSASTMHLHREPCSEHQAQVFGLTYPPPHSWALENPLLSIRIRLPIILCGRRRQCTSTGSPAQNMRPQFLAWPTLPPQLSSREPPIVDQNCVVHHPVRSVSTLHLHREPCLEYQARFLACPTLFPQLTSREPLIVDQNWVAHHLMRSASTLHLHREPCSEHQAAVFGLTYPSPPQLSPREPPIVDQNCVAHHPVWSASTMHLHREPCSEHQAQVFGLTYPPPHSWALENPLLSIRIRLPIILCGRRRQCTSTGSPAQNIRPQFLA